MLIMFCLLILSFVIILYKVYKFCTEPLQPITTVYVQTADDIADELVLVHSNPWEI
jgi:hypothetical protein